VTLLTPCFHLSSRLHQASAGSRCEAEQHSFVLVEQPAVAMPSPTGAETASDHPILRSSFPCAWPVPTSDARRQWEPEHARMAAPVNINLGKHVGAHILEKQLFVVISAPNTKPQTEATQHITSLLPPCWALCPYSANMVLSSQLLPPIHSAHLPAKRQSTLSTCRLIADTNTPSSPASGTYSVQHYHQRIT
jgi:hypothetical protein